MPFDPDTGLWLPDFVDNEALFSGGPDFRFDEYLNLSEEHQSELVEWLGPHTDCDRKRARKAEAQARFQKVLGCIVANAIAAAEERPATYVHYSRKEGEYVGSTPYKPDWLLSTQLIETIDGLTKAGLVKSIKASRSPADLKQFRSTYRAARAFLGALRARGFILSRIIRDTDAAPVIWLRSGDRKNLPYKPESVPDQPLDLRAYNTFLDEQEIGLDLPRGETCARAPNLKFKATRRIYNGSFDRGGRLYGGWWQGQPESIREHITIGGERTVELDFSSFLARALYHEAGIDYRGDPYDVPELRAAFEQAAIPWEGPRNARSVVKELFFVMLNSKDRRGIQASAVANALPKTITPKEAYEAIERHNLPIKDRFFTGYSMTLMKKESNLCAQILQSGLEKRIPVLQIHDSYIVKENEREFMLEEMNSRYRDLFGYNPVIK